MEPEHATQKTLTQWSEEILEWCERKGWNRSIVLGNVMCNLHTEISEACEEIRNEHSVGEIYYSEGDKPEGFPIALVDLIIRVLHIFAYYGIDPDQRVRKKMEYNKTRAYRHGGKIF